MSDSPASAAAADLAKGMDSGRKRLFPGGRGGSIAKRPRKTAAAASKKPVTDDPEQETVTSVTFGDKTFPMADIPTMGADRVDETYEALVTLVTSHLDFVKHTLRLECVRQNEDVTTDMPPTIVIDGRLGWLVATSITGLDPLTANPKDVMAALYNGGGAFALWKIQGPLFEYLYGRNQPVSPGDARESELSDLLNVLASISDADNSRLDRLCVSVIMSVSVVDLVLPCREFPRVYLESDQQRMNALKLECEDVGVKLTLVADRSRIITGPMALAYMHWVLGSTPSKVEPSETIRAFTAKYLPTESDGHRPFAPGYPMTLLHPWDSVYYATLYVSAFDGGMGETGLF